MAVLLKRLHPGLLLLLALLWGGGLVAAPVHGADQRLSADEWAEMTQIMKRHFPKVVNPATTPYSFLAGHPTLGETELYIDKRRAGKNPRTLAAFIDGPEGYNICFHGHKKAWMSADPRDRALTFRTGVYPFYLYPRTALKDTECRPGNHPGEVFYGALAVYNLDVATSSASFGRTPGATLFDDAVLDRVRQGALVQNTLRYAGQDRLSYWIGNRPGGFSGGVATAVLDFSASPGLARVALAGQAGHRDKAHAKNQAKAQAHDALTVTVPVYRIDKGKQGAVVNTPLIHRVALTRTDGHRYLATISAIADTAYGAFMAIPCAIPADLFAAADSGAGARLVLQPEGAESPLATLSLATAP